MLPTKTLASIPIVGAGFVPPVGCAQGKQHLLVHPARSTLPPWHWTDTASHAVRPGELPLLNATAAAGCCRAVLMLWPRPL